MSLLSSLQELIKKLDEKLKEQSPFKVIGTTLVLAFFVRRLCKLLGNRWNEQWNHKVGRWALSLGVVANEFRKETRKTLEGQKLKVQKSWAKFGEPIVEMPELGWSLDSLKELVDRYTALTNPHLGSHYLSGTIYSFSLRDQKEGKQELGKFTPTTESRDITGPAAYIKLAKMLEEAYTYSFRHTYLWNSLHGNEFGIGDFIAYQVVRIVGGLYGAKPEDSQGFVTSGGTESLMLATRIYRNWGYANKGLQPGEPVVLACDSVHAAVMKAGDAYNVRVVLHPAREDGRVDLKVLEKQLQHYGNNVVAIVGSAPSYALGVVDDIRPLAALAKKYNVGFHIDSCLGGFILNNLRDTAFFKIDGVTSLSVDTHKNGWAPKGSSVLLTGKLNDKIYGDTNLSFYSTYAVPGWTGGVYGTPKDPGSHSVVASLHALLALLGIGRQGYQKLAKDVNATAVGMSEVILKHPELVLLGGRPECNVVAWGPSSRWTHGAIYALAHEMEKRGFTVNALARNKAHFCVTGRTAGDPTSVAKFEEALAEAVAAVTALDESVRAGKIQFPGDAGLYGTLEAAMQPANTRHKNKGEYWKNMLLGKRGAEDGVRAFFYAYQAPWNTGGL